MSTLPTPEFAPLYTSKERLRLAATGLTLGGGVVWLMQGSVLPFVKTLAQSGPCFAPLGEAGPLWFWFSLFAGWPLLAGIIVALSFGWRGVCILRSNQAPPPGVKVMRPTPIVRGGKARAWGWVHIAACVPLFLLAAWGTIPAGRLAQQSMQKCVDTRPIEVIAD